MFAFPCLRLTAEDVDNLHLYPDDFVCLIEREGSSGDADGLHSFGKKSTTKKFSRQYLIDFILFLGNSLMFSYVNVHDFLHQSIYKERPKKQDH